MAHVARSRVISYTQIPLEMDLKSRASMMSPASEVQAYCHREALQPCPSCENLTSRELSNYDSYSPWTYL